MIRFILKNTKKPVGCWLDYYHQHGILKVAMEITKFKNIKFENFILSYHLYANSKTAALIGRKILHSWLYYNIDKTTGLLQEDASPRKNKTKAELSAADYQLLHYDEIQYGVTIDESVPDNEIQFRMNKTDTTENIIILNNKEANALISEINRNSEPNDNLRKLFKEDIHG